jgi:GNAT superfamily N-acetyltransferase
MTGLTAQIREYAEVPDRFAHVVEGASVSRFDDGRVCVIHGPTRASVSGVNVAAGEVGALVEQVRALVSPAKHCTWWLAPSCKPADLPQRLLEHGLTVAETPLVKALALVEAPPPLPPGVDVRQITTFEEFVAAREVQWDAFDVAAERRELQREHLRADFDESIELGIPVGFLARLDGREAATGLAVPSERGVFLIAGSTAPWARGRGLYRALVRARWDYAAARGTPALATQAVPDTSYPILKRIGFQDVCDVVRREDLR